MKEEIIIIPIAHNNLLYQTRNAINKKIQRGLVLEEAKEQLKAGIHGLNYLQLVFRGSASLLNQDSNQKETGP